SVNAISKQLANLDLKSLGKPLRIVRFGSTFNLATRNVSRDRGFNKTLLSMGVCICLSMIVLSGALVSADTSASYVVRAMPPHVLIVANSNINNQIIPEVDTGSINALIVGINATSAIGDWYTSDGFLQSSDAHYTMIAGDSLVGNIVQTPFNLSQVSALGYRYDVKSALVDP